MDKTLFPLEGYRALDLTNEQGYLCGRILGDLGVDVIKIEKVGGDPSRNIGPFFHSIPHPEKSLYWFAYNASKRGITLNIESWDGQEIFKRLVKTADIVVESFAPGYMDKIGLSYAVLAEINPGLIMTSITPFGQNGPYKHYKGADIVCEAMSGHLYLTGDPDRAPLRISFPQSYLHAGAQAAAATTIALYYREVSGEGQYIDVSIQHALMVAQQNATAFWEMNQRLLQRAGAYRVGLSTHAKQRQTWRCKDGFVMFAIMGGKAGATTNRALVEWMDSEGMADDFLKQIDWDSFDMARGTQETHDRFEDCIGRFFGAHTKAELYEKAIEKRIMLCPVSSPEDIVKSPQLAARNFWQEVEHPELNATITYPGTFAQSSEVSCRIRRRAPLIGEHNEEVYKEEIGFSEEEVSCLKQAKVI